MEVKTGVHPLMASRVFPFSSSSGPISIWEYTLDEIFQSCTFALAIAPV